VLDGALDAVSEAVAAGVATIVDGDVAVALHISGCSTGGRGTGWGKPGAVGGVLAVCS
jgi:hypothetical protein